MALIGTGIGHDVMTLHPVGCMTLIMINERIIPSRMNWVKGWKKGVVQCMNRGRHGRPNLVALVLVVPDCRRHPLPAT